MLYQRMRRTMLTLATAVAVALPTFVPSLAGAADTDSNSGARERLADTAQRRTDAVREQAPQRMDAAREAFERRADQARRNLESRADRDRRDLEGRIERARRQLDRNRVEGESEPSGENREEHGLFTPFDRSNENRWNDRDLFDHYNRGYNDGWYDRDRLNRQNRFDTLEPFYRGRFYDNRPFPRYRHNFRDYDLFDRYNFRRDFRSPRNLFRDRSGYGWR